MNIPDQIDLAAENTARSCEAAVAAIRARVDRPGSAICTRCEEPIPAARRKALPSATRCLSCQSALEGVR